jgi:hypothetical protein
MPTSPEHSHHNPEDLKTNQRKIFWFIQDDQEYQYLCRFRKNIISSFLAGKCTKRVVLLTIEHDKSDRRPYRNERSTGLYSDQS